jgi:hypothetical protein
MTRNESLNALIRVQGFSDFDIESNARDIYFTSDGVRYFWNGVSVWRVNDGGDTASHGHEETMLAARVTVCDMLNAAIASTVQREVSQVNAEVRG